MIIIRDTREQIPWDFSFYSDFDGESIQTLKTGDYTVFGYENKIIIDRKKSIDEICSNVFDKRFLRECERFKDYEQAYIVCEFTVSQLSDYPKGSLNPTTKVCGRTILCKITDIESNYNVKFIFSQNREDAQEKVIELFRKIICEKN